MSSTSSNNNSSSSSSSNNKNIISKISNELQEREKKCNDITIYEYDRPKKELYNYEDIETFKKENPFNEEKNCKIFIPYRSDKIKMDKYKRYYKDVYTPARCKDTKGFWVGSTVNRNNNYDKGSCWKEPEDAECGELLTNYKFLRKDEYKNISRDEVKKARKQCEVNPKCHFKRINEYKRDCILKSKLNRSIKKSSTKINSSSKKSSLSSTNKGTFKKFDINNIEKSLEEFYSSKYAPETAELIGKGNRCVEGYINSKSSTTSYKTLNSNEEKIQIVDVIDPNLDDKIDYVNNLIKLENIDGDLSLDKFIDKYSDYFKEYVQYLIINLDPNDIDNEDEIKSYLNDYKLFNNYVKEYNNYIKEFKSQYNPGHELKIPKGEHKYYYRNVTIFYNKYFPVYFDTYEDISRTNLIIVQNLFIRYLILTANPIHENKKLLRKIEYQGVINLFSSSNSSVSVSSHGKTSDKYFLSNYMKDDKKFNEFKRKIMDGILFDYSEYFPHYFNEKFDIYLEKIKKKYYIYSRYIISKIDPNDKTYESLLLYFINNHSLDLLNEFRTKYNILNKQHTDIYDYYNIYNKYFEKIFQYEYSLEYIFYIKHKIYILDPNIKEQYEELSKYMKNPSLIKEFKKNYNLIQTNSNYDELLQGLYIRYFPDYFDNIDEKYKSLSSSISLSTSTQTPVISSITSISSSQIKPPKLPTVPQSIINNISKLIYENKLNKRGMLIWHSTGSGKTCTATAIMEGFWGTDMDIIYCSKIEALSNNPPHTFYKCATDLFPRFAGKSLTQMEKEFKNIRFLSFAKLANRIANNTIDLNNCILIIDEVHNLFRPLANQKKQHEYLEKLLLNEKKFPNLKVFILTATLGDNPNEIIKLLNIVKNNNVEKITLDDIKNIPVFKEKIRGLISYFDMSNDRSKFPLVRDNEPKYINMSNKQFETYIQKYKEVKDIHKNYDKLAAANSLNKYWMAARKYSNMLYNFERGLTLHDFSAKLEELILSILTFPDQKQYVYSAFYENRGYGGQGILAISLELKKKGYEQLTPSEAVKIYNNPTDDNKGKRFILAITTQLGIDKGKELSDMIKLYNAPFNKNGEFVNLILASQSYNEGMDLKGVRHIHIFEPLLTWASDKQTIGRAARNCSHSDLRLRDWTVDIHRYISNFPEEVVPDKNKLDELKSLLDTKTTEYEAYARNLKEVKAKIKTINTKITKLNKGKTSEEQRSIISLNKQLEDGNTLIKELDTVISEYKLEIKSIKKALKDLDSDDDAKGKTKGKKKGMKLDATGIENIDKFIYNQAIEKMKDILTLYQAMQESAIDCLILNNFHKNGNKIIECTKY